MSTETIFLDRINSTDTINLSDYILIRLNMLGVDKVFSLTGGGIMYIIDAIARSPNMGLVCAQHESFAGIAADAYTRAGKTVGVAIGTTGPGVTNLFTSVAAAWQDSSPVLFLGGQVKSSDSSRINKMSGLRQNGTFEFDAIDCFRPVTKYSTIVQNSIEGISVIEEALNAMLSGRTGPAYIEIPLDVQGANLPHDAINAYWKDRKLLAEYKVGNLENIDQEKISVGAAPIFIFGAGVLRARGEKACRAIARKFKIPFMVTPLAKSVGYHDDEYYLGVLSIRGNRSANIISQQADTIIIVGCSMHQQIVGWDPLLFNPNAKKYWFEIDDAIVACRKNDLNIENTFSMDVVQSLRYLTLNINLENDLQEWFAYCARIKSTYLQHIPISSDFSLYDALDALNDYMDQFGAVVTDAGQPWYIVPQVLKLTKNNTFISSGSFGSMGMTLPYIVGASQSCNVKPVLGVVGDGSLMMCASELSTLKTSDSSFVLLIVNNGGYRSIKATQDKFFEGRKLGTDESSGVFIPDYKSLVSCFGIEYRSARSKNELQIILRDHLTKVDAIKLVVEVFTSEFETIEPLVVSKMNDEGTFENTAIDYMYPYVEFEEFHDFK